MSAAASAERWFFSAALVIEPQWTNALHYESFDLPSHRLKDGWMDYGHMTFFPQMYYLCCRAGETSLVSSENMQYKVEQESGS